MNNKIITVYWGRCVFAFEAVLLFGSLIALLWFPELPLLAPDEG